MAFENVVKTCAGFGRIEVEAAANQTPPDQCYHRFEHVQLPPNFKYRCMFCGFKVVEKDSDLCEHDFEYHHKLLEWHCTKCEITAKRNPLCQHRWAILLWNGKEHCQDCGLSREAALAG